MKIYLAGPWIHRGDMPAIASQLEAAGHTITHRWWNYEGEAEHTLPASELARYAKLDVEGVKNCDIVFCINSAKSEGKAVEQGLAIAFEKPVILVTPGDRPSSNIFHYLFSFYHVKTVQEGIKAIKGYQ